MVWMKTCSRKQVLHELSLRPQWIQYSVRLMENYHSGVCWLSLSLTVTIVTWSPMTTSVPSPQGVMRLSLWKLYLNKHGYMRQFPLIQLKKNYFSTVSQPLYLCFVSSGWLCGEKQSWCIWSDKVYRNWNHPHRPFLSMCCASCYLFFFMFAALVDIDTSLSYNACSLIAEILQRGQGKSTSSGKDIFQFKYGLFIELLGQGANVPSLPQRNEAFTCPEYLALHAFQRFERPSFPQVNFSCVFVLFERSVSVE